MKVTTVTFWDAVKGIHMIVCRTNYCSFETCSWLIIAQGVVSLFSALYGLEARCSGRLPYFTQQLSTLWLISYIPFYSCILLAHRFSHNIQTEPPR